MCLTKEKLGDICQTKWKAGKQKGLHSWQGSHEVASWRKGKTTIWNKWRERLNYKLPRSKDGHQFLFTHQEKRENLFFPRTILTTKNITIGGDFHKEFPCGKDKRSQNYGQRKLQIGHLLKSTYYTAHTWTSIPQKVKGLALDGIATKW